MKCNKCGQTINGSLCLNCGEINNYTYSNTIGKKYETNKNNNKLNKKSILVIFLCLVIIGTLIGSVIYLTGPKKIDLTLKYNAVEMLDKDFNNNKLSVNDYVLYSAYSIYDYKKLPKEYQTNTFQFAPDINYLYSEYKDQLDSSTIEYLEEKLYLKNVRLGSKTSSDSVSYLPLIDKVSAEENENTISQLDKAVTSNDVIIWYTNKGKDAISDESAKEIANNIDTVINDLAMEFGVPYKFKNQFKFTEENRIKKERILNDLGISLDYMNKLNVYVYNYGENSKVYGRYNKQICTLNSTVAKCDTNSIDSGLIMAPYISLNTKTIEEKVDTRVIYTHELYHQLQHNLASNGKFDITNVKSDSNNNKDFTSETTANYATALLNPNIEFTSATNYLNEHAWYSTQNINESINKIDGYASYRFLKNYSDVVENGKFKVRDSILHENRIKYLYDESNGKFTEVMANYGMDTLTNNYSINSFKMAQFSDGKKLPYIINLPINDSCINGKCKSINPASVNYYRIDLSDYKEGDYLKFKSKDIDDLNVQMISAKREREFLYSKVPKYSYEFRNKTNIFTLKTDSYVETNLGNYKDEDELFIVISNGNIDKKGNYEITINNKKEGTNEDSPNNYENKEVNTTNNSDNLPTKIYLNDKDLELDSFNYNWRTYVELDEFCRKVGCNLENKDDKRIITRDVTNFKSNTTGKYVIELDINKSNYNSKLILNNSETDFFNLVQNDIEDKSCPTEKDRYGILPKKTCTDKETYVPLRFIMQGLGYIVDWKPETTENKVLLYDNVIREFENKGYRFVVSKTKVEEGKEVPNPIEINTSIVNIEKEILHYIYMVDKDNIKRFKTSFAFSNPIDLKETYKGKYFEKIEPYYSNEDHFLVSKGDVGDKENIIIVGNYKITKDEEHEYRTENVSYPIYYEVTISIGDKLS